MFDQIAEEIKKSFRVTKAKRQFNISILSKQISTNKKIFEELTKEINNRFPYIEEHPSNSSLIEEAIAIYETMKEINKEIITKIKIQLEAMRSLDGYDKNIIAMAENALACEYENQEIINDIPKIIDGFLLNPLDKKSDDI